MRDEVCDDDSALAIDHFRRNPGERQRLREKIEAAPLGWLDLGEAVQEFEAMHAADRDALLFEFLSDSAAARLAVLGGVMTPEAWEGITKGWKKRLEAEVRQHILDGVDGEGPLASWVRKAIDDICGE
jgi:hypothetical protein